MNGYAQIRRDRADSHLSQRGRESSSRDDKWRASRDVRCQKNEKAEEWSDMVVDGFARKWCTTCLLLTVSIESKCLFICRGNSRKMYCSFIVKMRILTVVCVIGHGILVGKCLAEYRDSLK